MLRVPLPRLHPGHLVSRAARRAAARARAKGAGKAGRERMARQADTRTALREAVEAWARESRAGELGPLEAMPITRLDTVNAAGLPIHVEILVNVTPNP